MNVIEQDFPVRGYESGVDNHVTLPTVCNYLQEIAGNHAERLGFGIREMQERDGTSWMLSRLHVQVDRFVPWGETLHLRSWPSGIRGRLVANRDFVGTDDAGRTVLEAVSEWLVVDLKALKIVWPTETFKALSVDAPRVGLAAADGGGKFAALAKVDAEARILVRRGDHDFNDHVNNVHYVEWALEAVPEAFRGKFPHGLDIVFRQAAHAGDELASRLEVVDETTLRHAIVRLSDNQLLATAETTWK